MFDAGRSNCAKPGGAEGDRTPDLLHAMQALSQTELQPRTSTKIKNIQGKLGACTCSLNIFLEKQVQPQVPIKYSKKFHVTIPSVKCFVKRALNPCIYMSTTKLLCVDNKNKRG